LGEFFVGGGEKSVSVRKSMAVLTAPRLHLQAQVTVASLGSCHTSGECAKSCVRRSVCACNPSGGAASSIGLLT